MYIFIFSEFDFTVARGLGALHKELSSLNVPLVLLGPVSAVQTVLHGALQSKIPEIECETELDNVLYENGLQDVVAPLLINSSGEHSTDTLEKRK